MVIESDLLPDVNASVHLLDFSRGHVNRLLAWLGQMEIAVNSAHGSAHLSNIELHKSVKNLKVWTGELWGSRVS